MLVNINLLNTVITKTYFTKKNLELFDVEWLANHVTELVTPTWTTGEKNRKGLSIHIYKSQTSACTTVPRFKCDNKGLLKA